MRQRELTQPKRETEVWAVAAVVRCITIDDVWAQRLLMLARRAPSEAMLTAAVKNVLSFSSFFDKAGIFQPIAISDAPQE